MKAKSRFHCRLDRVCKLNTKINNISSFELICDCAQILTNSEAALLDKLYKSVIGKGAVTQMSFICSTLQNFKSYSSQIQDSNTKHRKSKLGKVQNHTGKQIDDNT